MAFLVLSPLIASCGGETRSTQRVHIVSGVLVYNGFSTIVALDLQVDAAQEPTTFSWRVGAVPERGLCRQALGWRLDVSSPTDASTQVAANETRELRLRATSYDRPTCNPTEPVARCGDSVTVLVMTGDDDFLAALDTTFECLFVAQTLR